jgi:hypothetical protein
MCQTMPNCCCIEYPENPAKGKNQNKDFIIRDIRNILLIDKSITNIFDFKSTP